MRRGIIRIIAGTVMVLLQIFVMISQASVESTVNKNIWYIIGYYSVGVTGAFLLFFGVRACSDGLCSQLILHSRTKKIHTVIKWAGFTISTVLFLLYLLSFIYNWDNLNIFTLLIVFSALSYSLYSLFYMYKKPSCLFSTTLLLLGVAYIYNITSNLTYYFTYLYDEEYFVSIIILGILPRVIAGVLYIIIATKIYNERFSVKVIKTLGWTVFALEIINRVIGNIVFSQSINFIDLMGIFFILFIVILMLYTSIFEVNTLRGMTASNDNTEKRKFIYANNREVDAQIPSMPKCEMCGKEDPNLTSSKIVDNLGTRYRNLCADCMEKYNAEAIEKEDEVVIKSDIKTDADEIKFCRKCGEKFIDNSKFCRKCGTEIITELIG